MYVRDDKEAAGAYPSLIQAGAHPSYEKFHG